MERVYSWYNSTIACIYFLCEDTYKEVLNLIVSYNFNCLWNSTKKERISHLLSERILLLTGIRIYEKVEGLNFCEKEWIQNQLPESISLLSDDRLAFLHISKVSYKITYELFLEKDILLSMLMPGAGQSYFDDMILKLIDVIQNNKLQSKDGNM